jgi:hypothetical protein
LRVHVLACALLVASSGIACDRRPEYAVRREVEPDGLVAHDFNVSFDDFYRSFGGSISKNASATEIVGLRDLPKIVRVAWSADGGRKRCRELHLGGAVPAGFPERNGSTIVIVIVRADEVAIRFEVPASYGDTSWGKINHGYKDLPPRAAIPMTDCAP